MKKSRLLFLVALSLALLIVLLTSCQVFDLNPTRGDIVGIDLFSQNGNVYTYAVTYEDGSVSYVEVIKSGDVESNPEEGVCLHDYSEWESVDNVADGESCEEQIYYCVCKNCNKIEWKMGGALAHEYYEYSLLPTCHSGGSDHKVCKNCGKSQITNVTSAVAHSFSQLYFANDTHHWNSCLYCNEKSRYGMHTYDSDGKCTVCNNSRYPSEGILYALSEDSSYAIVKEYNGDEEKVRIASEYSGVPVKVIADGSFYCKPVKSVIIPDTVTEIEDSAFHTSNLQGLYIPASVTKLSSNFLSWNTELFSFEVDAKNPKYYSKNNCIIDGETKTLIRACNSSVIPNDGSIDVISSGAFQGCAMLDRLYVPASVKEINDKFQWCFIELIEVDPANTAYYSSGNCLIERETKTLIKACNTSTIPKDEGIKIIGENAFSECCEMKSVVVPEGVTRIEYGGFFQCWGLESIVLPESLEYIGDEAFTLCSFKSLHLGKNVTSVVGNAFRGVTKLESINVSEDNPNYKSQGNCLIDIEQKSIIVVAKNCVIPSDGSVTTIPSRTFYNHQMEELVIPASITRISESAFENTEIKRVIFEDKNDWVLYTWSDEIIYLTPAQLSNPEGAAALLKENYRKIWTKSYELN